MTDQKQIITGLQEAAAYFRSSFDAMDGTLAYHNRLYGDNVWRVAKFKLVEVFYEG